MSDPAGGRLAFRGVIDACTAQSGRPVREFIFDPPGSDSETEFP